MINFSFKIVCALSLFALSVPAYPQAAVKPVQIIATGMHYGGYVIYRYQVKNKGAQSIDSISLGFTSEEDSSFVGFTEWPDNPTPPEMVTALSWYPAIWYPPTIISSPDGWGGKRIGEQNETGEIGISWAEGSYAQKLWPRSFKEIHAPKVYPGGKAIAPGQTSSEFSVKVDRPDYAYVQGYASVSYGTNLIFVPIEKGDSIPPTLTVSANPAVLWPPNNKMVDIAVNLTVKDNFDPQPEIKLESITANEPLSAADIAGANIGTDHRRFSLRASRAGDNPAGRRYTLTYSATDASGNKATASTTVTVPHDQR